MAKLADDELVLTVGPVAHGGHCVARIPESSDDGKPNPDAGRVVFVRHALPGERVIARITDKGKIWRADAIAILENSSLDRVPTIWPEAGSDGVGGGELAHVSPDGQRRWKAAVVAEQMRRLAGVDISQLNPDLAVSAVTLGPLHHQPYRADTGSMSKYSLTSGGKPQWDDNSHPAQERSLGVDTARGGESENGYRTRIDLLVDDQGRAGMRQARSHQIIPLTDMPLATDELRAFAKAKGVWTKRWKPGSRLTVIAPANSRPGVPDSQPLLLIDGEPQPRPDGSTGLTELVTVNGRTYTHQLAPNGFWQVHAEAPQTLVEAVLAAAGDLEARRVLELYSGAGLFTLPLAAAIGSHGKLVTVEGSKPAVEFA